MTAQQHIKSKFSRYIVDYTGQNTALCCLPNYNAQDEEGDAAKAIGNFSMAPSLFNQGGMHRLAKIDYETKNKCVKRAGEEPQGVGTDLEVYYSHPLYWREYQPKTRLCMIYPYPDINHGAICNFRIGDIITGNNYDEFIINDINDLEGGLVDFKAIGGASLGDKFVMDFEDFIKILNRN